MNVFRIVFLTCLPCLLLLACSPTPPNSDGIPAEPISETSHSETAYPDENSKEPVTDRVTDAAPDRQEPPADSANEPSMEQSRDVTDAAEPASEPTPDVPVEGVPEQSPEPTPDVPALPPLKVKAVSLRASFLQNSLQAGLLEKRSGQWELELVVPAGSHTLALTVDGKTSTLYTLPARSQSQAPMQVIGQPQNLSLTQNMRLKLQVDPTKRRVSWSWEREPLAVRIRGDWNGNTGQMASLTSKGKGLFVWETTLKKGTVRWWLETGSGAAIQTLQVTFPPRHSLDVGGTLKTGKQPWQFTLSNDVTIRLEVEPLQRRWRLLEVRPTAAKSWKLLLDLIQKSMSPASKLPLVKEFLTTRRKRRELPIVEGNQVTFVLLQKPIKAPFYVSGSFNNWSKNTVMSHVKGMDLYYATITVPNNAQYEYKFRDAADRWMPDPHNPRYVYAGLGSSVVLNSVLQVGISNKSHLERFDGVKATLLNNQRSVRVYVPPGYDPTKRYPVLYMHDGQNLFNPKAAFGHWGVREWADKLIAQKKMRPFLIVGIDNTGASRMDEYTHTTDILNKRTVGGKATLYADFLWDELKPHVDGLYSTLPGRRSTAVMGSSLGGLVSMWMGWTSPERVFRVGALSSTYIWGRIGGNNQTLVETVDKDAFRNLIVYTDSGSPKDNSVETKQMADNLLKKGYVSSLNLLYHLEQGAAHNEKAWRARLFRPLQFLCSW